MARRTGSLHPKDPARLDHLPLTTTVIAGFHGGSILSTIATTVVASPLSSKLDRLSHTTGGFKKVYRYFTLDVCPTANPATSLPAAEHIAKNTTPKNIAKRFKDIANVLEACPSLQTRMAVPVIARALFAITENLKGFGGFLKPYNRLFIARFFIGVVLDRQLAVCDRNFVRCGRTGHLEDFVIAALLGHAHNKL
jgi:hypothetical protein